MFYAAYHDYDIRSANDVNSIRRFKTKAERDQWVHDEEPDRRSNFHWEAVTRDQARSHCPNAFRIVDDDNWPDERDWYEDRFDNFMFYWEYDI